MKWFINYGSRKNNSPKNKNKYFLNPFPIHLLFLFGKILNVFAKLKIGVQDKF